MPTKLAPLGWQSGPGTSRTVGAAAHSPAPSLSSLPPPSSAAPAAAGTCLAHPPCHEAAKKIAGQV